MGNVALFIAVIVLLVLSVAMYVPGSVWVWPATPRRRRYFLVGVAALMPAAVLHGVFGPNLVTVTTLVLALAFTFPGSSMLAGYQDDRSDLERRAAESAEAGEG